MTVQRATGALRTAAQTHANLAVTLWTSLSANARGRHYEAT
jgi:hypothetical protein